MKIPDLHLMSDLIEHAALGSAPERCFKNIRTAVSGQPVDHNVLIQMGKTVNHKINVLRSLECPDFAGIVFLRKIRAAQDMQ